MSSHWDAFQVRSVNWKISYIWKYACLISQLVASGSPIVQNVSTSDIVTLRRNEGIEGKHHTDV